MQAYFDGYSVVSAYFDGNVTPDGKNINSNLLKKYDFVVTTTGNINVLDKHIHFIGKSGCVVCNIGHFNNEIDIDFLHEYEWHEVKPGLYKIIRGKNDYLILLAKVFVNLALVTGHPSRVTDGSFATVLAQIFLTRIIC